MTIEHFLNWNPVVDCYEFNGDFAVDGPIWRRMVEEMGYQNALRAVIEATC